MRNIVHYCIIIISELTEGQLHKGYISNSLMHSGGVRLQLTKEKKRSQVLPQPLSFIDLFYSTTSNSWKEYQTSSSSCCSVYFSNAVSIAFLSGSTILPTISETH